eukprot:c23929_g1_i7 orf=282-515(+)
MTVACNTPKMEVTVILVVRIISVYQGAPFIRSAIPATLHGGEDDAGADVDHPRSRRQELEKGKQAPAPSPWKACFDS